MEIVVKLVIGHPLLPGHLVPLLLYLLDPHLIEQADEGSDVIINRYLPVRLHYGSELLELVQSSSCCPPLRSWLQGSHGTWPLSAAPLVGCS